MNNETEILKKRFLDLANKAYSRDISVFSNFLGLSELSIYYDISKELSFVKSELFGGTEFSERKIIRFGNLDTDFPISCIHITPTLKKFSDQLNHRDFLGALINLGIKRETLGDIIVKDNEAFVLCLNSIAEYIVQNLTRVKHTVIKCSITASLPDNSYINLIEKELNVASLRLDAIIGEVFKLSRSQAQLAIREKRVFVNGRQNENNSYNVKEGDTISVRGFGKFIFGNEIRTTKKGRYFVTCKLFS